MSRVEDFINSAKTNEMLGELLHIKKEEEKKELDSGKGDWNPEI